GTPVRGLEFFRRTSLIIRSKTHCVWLLLLRPSKYLQNDTFSGFRRSISFPHDASGGHAMTLLPCFLSLGRQPKYRTSL
ncbi:MAG: hypothetical protein FWD31_02990, partial [Planctomycetaceae bacterium]|nr:hypothetical protein [Planctomycetaceae bacterium]